MTPWPPQESELVEPQPPSIHFSGFVTGCFAVIFLFCAGFLTFAHLSMPRLARVSSPEKALEIITNQVMVLKEGLDDVSQWERRMTDSLGEAGGELAQFIDWYVELSAQGGDPLSDLYLATLEGEAGRTQSVLIKAQMWKDWQHPFPIYAQILDAAYLSKSLDPQVAGRLQSQLAEEIPSGWFYSRLAMRLAERSDDVDLMAMAENQLDTSAQRLVWNNRLIGALEMSGFMAGVMATYFLWRRWKWGGAKSFKVGLASLPPEWSGRHGVVVLIRGGGIASLFIIGLSVTGIGQNVLQFMIPFAIHLPILFLAVYYLWRPVGLSFRQATGLQIQPGSWGPFWSVTLTLFAFGVAGGWAVGLLAEVTHASFHWTDWFDQTLIQGTLSQLLPPLISYTLLAPIFEELVFRGVLYGTLRRRLNAPSAILVSAALFALAHGYGALGSLTIFWSGILWAWSYEKTGSLLPGITAHALNNSLVCLTVLLLVRPG